TGISAAIGCCAPGSTMCSTRTRSGSVGRAPTMRSAGPTATTIRSADASSSACSSTSKSRLLSNPGAPERVDDVAQHLCDRRVIGCEAQRERLEPRGRRRTGAARRKRLLDVARDGREQLARLAVERLRVAESLVQLREQLPNVVFAHQFAPVTAFVAAAR